jgi:hypothetical protein
MPATMHEQLKILENATPTRAFLRLVRLRSYKSVLVSAVNFVSDIIDSKPWSFGSVSYRCELSSVGLEEVAMEGRDRKASLK